MRGWGHGAWEGAEGAGVSLVGAGLFGWEGASALALPFSIPDFLLTSLEIGQWCCFLDLWVANLHLHNLHCQCDWPWAASSAAFWLSRLAVPVLFHARHFLSFWAWVAILVPLVRSKKAHRSSSLRSSKIKTNITLFTFKRG
jgi:hypothetical protein